MKIKIKNGTMEFLTSNAYDKITKTIPGTQQSWFLLPVPASSGQVYQAKVTSIGGASWTDSNVVIGFCANSSTAPVEPDRALIDKDNVGTTYQITLSSDFSYWYVYIPPVLRSSDVTVEIQRIS